MAVLSFLPCDEPVENVPRGLLMAKRNSPFRQIVGRNLYHNFVSWQDANEVQAHFARNMGQNLMAIGQFDPKHRVRQELYHLALYFNCVFPRHVRISGSFSVIKPVCSKWADGIPSAVQAVQPSSSNLTAAVPKLIIGSIASVIPGLRRGPLPRLP